MKVSLMKAPKTGTRSAIAFREKRSRLHVVLVYEDFATGTRAKSLFDQLSDQPELNAVFSLNLWRFDLLREPELNRRAVENAATADIIVFSAHGQADPPAEIQLWFYHWLQKTGDQPAALVVSLDSDNAELSSENRTLKFIRSLVEPVGVDVFPHFGEPMAEKSEWTTDWVEQRVNARSSLLEGILHQRSSYEHWGLNE